MRGAAKSTLFLSQQRSVAVTIAAMLVVSTAATAASYTVTGILHTAQGGNSLANDVPARFIKVIVMDEDIIFDDVMGTGFTGMIGEFSVSFTNTIEAPDIYINVEHVGTAVSGRFIQVRASHSDSDPIIENNVEGVVHNNIPEGTWGLGTLRLGGTQANIISQIGDAVRFLQGTYAPWAMPEDMIVEARTTDGASFVAGDGSYVSIAFEDYDHPGMGSAAFSDIHHEAFHWVAYRAYGNRWPFATCSPSQHSATTESCEGFAIQEASAQYFASASHLDHKTQLPPNANIWWRGSDGTGNNHSGEIVEGALEFIWRTIADHAGAFQVFLTDAPDSMKEFKDAYAADLGATSPEIRTFLDRCAENGIVYTRGRIDGFTPGDPPDTSPPDPGNFKIIDGIAFARGEVVATIVELTSAELRLAQNSATVPADQKDLGVRPAMPGLAEASAAGFSFVGPVMIGSDLVWDTGGSADGDYDVIVRLRSVHEWWDTFLPDFTGDTYPPTDSTEKWLKTLRTWFNQDSLPDNDDEGKVVVDNTEPTVSDFKPQ